LLYQILQKLPRGLFAVFARRLRVRAAQRGSGAAAQFCRDATSPTASAERFSRTHARAACGPRTVAGSGTAASLPRSTACGGRRKSKKRYAAFQTATGDEDWADGTHFRADRRPGCFGGGDAGRPDQGAAAIVQQTPVSTKMRMTLTGADFTITALSTEEQFVLGDAPTTWEWEIVPKHAGTLNLHLAAVVELDGMSRDYATVDRDIRVKVDPVNAFTTFVQANSVWVLTTLGAAVAALWGLWRKRKKAAASK
jgi:hypothetical protein